MFEKYFNELLFWVEMSVTNAQLEKARPRSESAEHKKAAEGIEMPSAERQIPP